MIQSPEPSPFALLEAHHLRRMQPELKQVLVLVTRGSSREAIAHAMGASAGTIKRWIDIATAEIMTCLDEGHRNRGELRGFWVKCHLPCCLADEAGAA